MGPYRDNGLETWKCPLIGRANWPSARSSAREKLWVRRLTLPVCQECPKSRRKCSPKVRAARIILPGPRRVTVVFPRITLFKVIRRLFRISRDRAVLFFEYLQALRRDPLAAEDR